MKFVCFHSILNFFLVAMLYITTEYLYFFVIRSAPAGAPAAEGGNQPPNLTSNRRLQQTQAQVDEVGTHLTANPVTLSGSGRSLVTYF